MALLPDSRIVEKGAKFVDTLMIVIRFHLFNLRYRFMRFLLAAVPAVSEPARAKRVLCFCSGGLGDMIMAEPFFFGLKKSIPDCRIDAVVPAVFAELVKENFPHVDRVVPFPFYGNYMGPKREWRFLSTLGKERYDLYFGVVDYTYAPRIPHNLYASMIGYVQGIPKRIGIYRQYTTGGRFEKRVVAAIFERGSLYTDYSFQRHGAHFVLEHMRLLELAGYPRRQPVFTISPPANRQEEVALLLEGFAEEGDLVVIISPTSAYRGKQWEMVKWAKVADRLVRDFGARVVISGAPKEETGTLIELLMEEECLNLSGTKALSLSQFVALMHRGNLCMGLDSGASHLAVACGTPVVMLFGPTPVEIAGPVFLENSCLIEAEKKCAKPCHGRDCTEEVSCMKSITVEEVCQAAASLILRSGNPSSREGSGIN